MNSLKQLNLTERDFDLMVQGLDALPEKGMAGELMGDLLIGMLSKEDDSEAKLKLKSEREQSRLKKAKEKEALTEDVKILQGKLLMLKRYLMQEGAIHDTYEIIDHIK